MLTRSTTAPSDSSVGSKSMLRRFFSSRPRDSTPAMPSREAPSPQEVFSQIMALNARHGHPEVQAYSVKVRPVEKKSKTVKASKSKTATIPTGPPPPYDAFDAIMRLNARHGHPSVQAHFVR